MNFPITNPSTTPRLTGEEAASRRADTLTPIPALARAKIGMTTKLDHGWKALLTLAQTPSCGWLKLDNADGVESLRIELRKLSLREHDAPPA